MSESLLTGTEIVTLSDEDLGRRYIESWLDFQSDKKGIPRSAEFDKAILTASAGMDSDSVKNSALENMFRKACAGDLATAGRMLREHLLASAHSMVLEKFAKTGLKVRKPYQEANAERHATTVGRNAELQRMANAKWAEPQHRDKSATAIAKMIDPTHYETTRRKIKKPKP